MAVYAVTYDLLSPGQDYSELHETLKSLGAYSKRFESFWLIDSSFSAPEIRDKIKLVVDANDKVLVIEVKKHWAGINTADGMINWLKSKKRTF